MGELINEPPARSPRASRWASVRHRAGVVLFLGLAIPMGGLLLWAVRDAQLEPTQRAFLLAATLATAAISAWLISLLD